MPDSIEVKLHAFQKSVWGYYMKYALCAHNVVISLISD